MKVVYTLLGLIALIFLTLHFWLSSDYVLQKINESQNILNIKSDESKGRFLTGYYYKNLQIQKDGKNLLTLDNTKISISVIKIFVGILSINIQSEKLKGILNISYDKKIRSDIEFNDILFDTEFINTPPSIAFSGFMNGRIKSEKDNISVEFNLNNLNWRSFEIEGNRLPYDIFTKARGGIEILGTKVNIKSFGFEGERGYARLVGEIVGGKSNIFVEIFPKDFSDPYMLPFYEYRKSPGYYKIPIILDK